VTLKDRVRDKPCALHLAESGHIVVSGSADAGVLPFTRWLSAEIEGRGAVHLEYDFVTGRAHDATTVLRALAAILAEKGIGCEAFEAWRLNADDKGSANVSVVVGPAEGGTVRGDVNSVVNVYGNDCGDPADAVRALLDDIEAAGVGITLVMHGMKMHDGIFSVPPEPIWDVIKLLVNGLCASSGADHRLLLGVDNANRTAFPESFGFHELGTVSIEDCGELDTEIKTAYFHGRVSVSYEAYLGLLTALQLDEV
jgi:hypothetical protein